MERLQTALHYELAVNGLDVGFYLGGLHSAGVRGADPISALAHWHEAVPATASPPPTRHVYQANLKMLAVERFESGR